VNTVTRDAAGAREGVIVASNNQGRTFMAETLRNPSTLASAISVVRSDDRRHARAAESAPRSAALTSSRQTLGDSRPRRRLSFDADEMRLSVGAVNVRSGNFVYFDTATHTIGRE
jgi:hypothetical protein